MPGEADKVGDSTSKFAMKKQVETGGQVNLIKRMFKEQVASRRIMSKEDMQRAQLKREMELKDKKEKVEARKMLKPKSWIYRDRTGPSKNPNFHGEIWFQLFGWEDWVQEEGGR